MGTEPYAIHREQRPRRGSVTGMITGDPRTGRKRKTAAHGCPPPKTKSADETPMGGKSRRRTRAGRAWQLTSVPPPWRHGRSEKIQRAKSPFSAIARNGAHQKVPAPFTGPQGRRRRKDKTKTA
jgi:hypothetical protein